MSHTNPLPNFFTRCIGVVTGLTSTGAPVALSTVVACEDFLDELGLVFLGEICPPLDFSGVLERLLGDARKPFSFFPVDLLRSGVFERLLVETNDAFSGCFSRFRRSVFDSYLSIDFLRSCFVSLFPSEVFRSDFDAFFPLVDLLRNALASFAMSTLVLERLLGDFADFEAGSLWWLVSRMTFFGDPTQSEEVPRIIPFVEE